MIEIASAIQFHNRDEITHVGLVSSENNVADGWTKEYPSDSWETLLDTGYDLNIVRKCIVKTPASSTSGKMAM